MNNDDTKVKALEKRIQALEDQNRELKTIIEEAPIPIFVINKDLKITHFNKACEKLTGFRTKDMIGTDNQWKAFYSKKRPVMADLIIKNSTDAQIAEHYGLKYHRAIPGEDRFAASDFFPDLGEDGKWLFFTAAPVKNAQGEIIGAVETLQDVTVEKLAQRSTRELNRHYRMILEFVPYPIVVYDREGYVSYVNPSFTRTFGWTIDELKGKTVPFVPDHLEKETSDMLDKFIEDRVLTRYETQRLTKNGKLLDVVLWATSYIRQQQRNTENVVIMRDITEEKRLAANNKTIMRISRALPEYPELKHLMNYITMEVKQLLNTEGALVLNYDEIKNEFFFLGASYDDTDTEERVKEVRFAANQVFAGEILKSGEPALINNPEESLKQYPERDQKLGYVTKTLLEVPIKSDGRIIGVLCAINKKSGIFNDNDVDLMIMIAGTVAISIENARFSEEVKKAYLDVASMNRAKGKAINHLSHELKTPVAILTGSLNILKKKLESLPEKTWKKTLDRIERNLERIVDIQDEVADIMKDKTYSAQKILLKMLETCQDELETLLEINGLGNEAFISSVRTMIDEKFGPRTLIHEVINFKTILSNRLEDIREKSAFRQIDISILGDDNIPNIFLPVDILNKVIDGLIRNAIENTPEFGKIDLIVKKTEKGVLFQVHDFGVGIEEDSQKRIFEGFFSTQETLLYSTKSPYAFNAGGKGADLLRMKIFSDRLGFSLHMESKRCRYLIENEKSACPGNIKECGFISGNRDCHLSGYSIFSVIFPGTDKKIEKSL